jgi:hypothetical protein
VTTPRGSILASLHVYARDVRIHSAVIRGRSPGVIVARDASEIGHMEASPFREGPGAIAAVLEAHDVGTAVVASPDGVRAKMTQAPSVCGGKTTLINDRLSD